MALGSFLKSVMPDIIRAAPAVIGALQRPRQTQAEQQGLEALNRQREYQEAAANPNSPIFQQLYNINAQKRRADFVSAIDEIVKTNRRNEAMGRQAMFDPERADEILNRVATKGFLDQEAAARDDTRNTILDLANQSGGMASAYQPFVSNQQDRIQKSQANRVDMAQTISDLILRAQQQRRSGGQNAANTPYAQGVQLATPRAFGGGYNGNS
ncbi:hypothetical protein EBZ39_07530 [bacterium]|nr:hypothetical protein [bacterium]